jgi:undecaprenyl-diphosphatase
MTSSSSSSGEGSDGSLHGSTGGASLEHLSEREIRRAMARDDAAALERWWPRDILIGAALWLVGALLLFAGGLYFSRHRTAALPGDAGLLALVQRIHQPLLVRFINLASDLNWPTPAGATVFAVTLLLLLAGRYRAALCALIAGFIADSTSFFLLNDWVRRARPHDVHIHSVGGIGATSYPSGHVVHVTAFYGFLLYLALREQRWHPRWIPLLRVVQAICGYFIVFIGISRLLEDDHWPSDVLAGYLLGAMMLAVAILLYHVFAWLWVHREELMARFQVGRG